MTSFNPHLVIPSGPERRASDLKNFSPAFVAQIERIRPNAYSDRFGDLAIGTHAERCAKAKASIEAIKPVSQPPAVKKEAA